MIFQQFNCDDYIDSKEKIILKKIIISEGNKRNYKTKNFIINVVNGREMLKINKRFLKKNYDTDVIAFSLSEEKMIIDCDIYINREMIDYNSKVFNCSLKMEYLRLVFHAFLHLMGKSDRNDEEKQEMRRLENLLLDKFLFHVKRSVIC